MREIKFRAWDGEILWEFGDTFSFYKFGLLINSKEEDRPFISYMQCIGLVDTNGKEIYEGDIISFKGDGEYGVIEYEEGAYGYRLYRDGVEQFFPYIGERLYEGEEELDYIPFEIIGNIYEDPDLIPNLKDETNT